VDEYRDFKFDHSKSQPTDDELFLKGACSHHVTRKPRGTLRRGTGKLNFPVSNTVSAYARFTPLTIRNCRVSAHQRCELRNVHIAVRVSLVGLLIIFFLRASDDDGDNASEHSDNDFYRP